MMNKETICAVVRDLLPSYIDGLTENATSIFIEQHLTECDACRAVKRSMQQITSPAEQAQAEFLDRLRRARVRRKRWAWLTGAVIVLILAVCFLPLPRSVRMNGPALKWRSGHPEEGSEQIQVMIKGTYMDYLFFDDFFDGDIMIEGMEITQREGVLSRVRMDQEGYLYYMNEEGLMRATGFIIAPPGFHDFVIGLYDYDENESHGSWSGDNGLMLTWGASSREEAVERTRQIVSQIESWLTGTVWEGGLMREEYEAAKLKATPN